ETGQTQHPATGIAGAALFDLDDVGAEIAKDRRTDRSLLPNRPIENSDPFQRHRHDRLLPQRTSPLIEFAQRFTATIATERSSWLRRDSVYKGGSEIEMRMAAAVRVVALLVATLAGCSAQKPDYLYVDMHARPVRLQLLKSFGSFDQHYEPVPINECAVYEAPTQSEGDRQPFPEEVWRVVSVAPDVPVLEVRYGAVPRGFLQSYP